MLYPTTHFHHILQNIATRSLAGLDVHNPNCHQEVAVFVCVGEKGEGGGIKRMDSVHARNGSSTFVLF